MKNIIITLLFLNSVHHFIYADNDIDDILFYDRLVNLSFEQVIEKLGEPDFLEERAIGFEIPLLGEKEPDYSRHFSRQELTQTVIIKYMSWKKGVWITDVWLKRTTENYWKVFHSEEYNSEEIEVG